MKYLEILEVVACAAIWYKEQPTAKVLPKNINKGVVVCGHRHPHCIYTFIALTGKRSVTPECGEYVQGFLTNHDRFVDRAEAASVAFNCGQITVFKNTLYSEDIY